MSTTTMKEPTAARPRPFSVERGVEAFAGLMVLLSVALTVFVHPGFAWLTVFVGANLLQQAFTGFCPAAIVMRKLGFVHEREIGEPNRAA